MKKNQNTKNKQSSYPKSTETFRNSPVFYEELAILKAQEKIAELMQNSNTTRTELARSLNQSKAHVTELLSDGHNLTLRTFARVCFHLNMEVDFHTHIIGSKNEVSSNIFHQSKITDTRKVKTNKNGKTLKTNRAKEKK